MGNLRLFRLLTGALVVSAGCTGSIEDESPGASSTAEPSSPDNPLPPPAAGSSCEGVKVDEPFRVLVHRLSATEYNNTVRDLLGDTSNPANNFPADAVVNGFDNVPEALFFSGEHAAAMDVATEAVAWNAVNTGKVACSPAGQTVACARPVLAALAERAWRRPVTPQEVDSIVAPLSTVMAAENNFKQALQVAVKRILYTPFFLYRPEIPTDPNAGGSLRLSDYDIASRLSYFLWSSMPDDALFAAARANKLQDPDELKAQVARMLRDPKSDALADNLSGQWLLGRITVVAARLDPKFDDELRAGLQLETKLFLKAFLQEDLSFPDMLDARFTFLTQRVAQHYKISGVQSKTPRRTMLDPQSHRGGLLTQGSILVGVTPKDRQDTPITQRGKWLLTNLFCSPPPPPPANVDELKKKIDATVPAKATRRQRQGAIAAQPECGGCHASMDGLGFALENYDINGAWRTSDGISAIDASGDVPGIGKFNGAIELAALLKQDDRLPSCVANMIATQALGRPMTDQRGGWLGDKERCTMSSLAEANRAKGYRLSEMISSLVQSRLFTQAGGEP